VEEADVLRLSKIQALKFRRTLPSWIELEDIVQAGCLAGIKALRRWRPEFGYACEAYVTLAARTGIIDELRRAAGGRDARSAKRSARHVSLDAPIPGDSEITWAEVLTGPNLEEEALTERRATMALQFMEEIPIREKLALKAYASLGSMAEAARYFEVSESRICQLIGRASKRLRRKIEAAEGG